MYNDLCPSLGYHTEYFHGPKPYLCSAYSSLPCTSVSPLSPYVAFAEFIQLES